MESFAKDKKIINYKIVPRFLLMEFIELYNFFSSQSNCEN